MSETDPSTALFSKMHNKNMISLFIIFGGFQIYDQLIEAYYFYFYHFQDHTTNLSGLITWIPNRKPFKIMSLKFAKFRRRRPPESLP